MRKALLCLFLSSLVLVSSLALLMQPQVAYVYAEEEVKFTASDVDVSAGGHSISLTLTLSVSVSVEGLIPLLPPMAFSGFGGDLKITVLQGAGSLTLTYDGMPYSQPIETPLESTEVSVSSVPEGTLYVIIVSPSLSANISAGNSISLEPDELTWKEEGTQTVHMKHGPLMEDIISMFDFGAIGLKVRLRYVLDVAVGASSGGTSVFERTASLGVLEGEPTVEASVWLLPVVPIVGGVILLAIVAAAVRRRRGPKMAYPETRRWVRCPRCGFEFPV